MLTDGENATVLGPSHGLVVKAVWLGPLSSKAGIEPTSSNELGLTLSGPQRPERLYFNDNLWRRFKLIVYFDRNGVGP